MSKYRISVSFEVRPPDGSPFPDVFDEIREFQSLPDAEKELESIISVMVSGYSDQGYEWTILEKCVEAQKAIQGSDLSALIF